MTRVRAQCDRIKVQCVIRIRAQCMMEIRDQ